jgi:hypothetical protein
LNHFGLQKNAIISVGYSTHKTVSNDGIAFVGESGVEYDPYSKFNDEQSCEDVLANLAMMSPGRFDFAVVDGNHEGGHLRKETAPVATAIAGGRCFDPRRRFRLMERDQGRIRLSSVQRLARS